MPRKITALRVTLLCTIALSGCQSHSSMVDHLPSPNFNGPVINAPVVAAQPRTPARLAEKPAFKTPVVGEKAWAINVAARPWKYIVIHHSASPSGNAAVFGKEHIRDNGWDELGYHFVIGNGTDSANGQIEIGPRWPKQKWGAHAKTPDNRFNDYGIGICLVGNFEVDKPTQAQLQSLSRLVSHLMQTYHVSPNNVIGHHDTKNTLCPGRYLNIDQVRRSATQMIADAGELVDEAQIASSTELLMQQASIP